MSKPPPARQTRDETIRERRALIVEAAAGCFIAKGFHQTSIREIARAAGVSLGNLYNHFDSKSALIAEIAALEAAELKAVLESLEGTEDPTQAIDRFVDAFLGYAMTPENAVLTGEIMAEAMRNPDIGKGFAANRQVLVDAVSKVLDRGIKCGQFDPGLDSHEASQLILDAIEGLALRSAFAGRKASRQARGSLVFMVHKFLTPSPSGD